MKYIQPWLKYWKYLKYLRILPEVKGVKDLSKKCKIRNY